MPGSSGAAPSRGYSRYALGVIFFANFLNYLDRFVASGLEDGITTELKIGETGWGFVYAAFTIGYLIASPFVGTWSDKYSRPRIFAACIAVWSVATIGCGLAHEAWELILCRVFVGVGEAGCLAIGPALVSDYFDPESRGRAMSIFFVGLPLGAIAGFVVAGLVPWRDAFLFGGGPGLVLMIVIFRLIDPPRGAHEHHAHAPVKSAGIRQYAGLLRNRTLVYIMLAQAFASFALIPLVHFGKDYFVEDKHWAGKDITWTLGIGMLAGMGGSIVSGWLGDRLVRRWPGAYAGIAGAGFLLGLPLLWVAVLSPIQWLSGTAFIATFFVYFACMPAVNAQIADVTSPSQRSMAFALAVFVLHVLGDTISPPLFGQVSDMASRTLAFQIFPLTLIGSGLLCLLAFRQAPKDIALLDQDAASRPLDSKSPPH